MFPLYEWCNLNGQLITRKSCVLTKNQTSPGLRGIERLVLRITKTVISAYYKGGCTILIVCRNSLLRTMPFLFAILSEGFKQKQLIFNLFVIILSDIRDFVGKISKKLLKLICYQWGNLCFSKRKEILQSRRNWNTKKLCDVKVL